MALQLLLLAIGLGCIVKGGDLFVSSSVRMAELLRMPPVVIGSTLVSLATTTPEMTVSVLSGLRGEPGLAVGNAVGSCLCNFGLILGAMAVLREVVVHPKFLRRPLMVMTAAAGLLLVFTLDLGLEQWQGCLLVVGGVGYFINDFLRHWRDGTRRELVQAEAVEADWVGRHPWLRTGVGTAALFALGALLVVGGSRLLVDAAVSLAGALGVPPMVLGLTVVAIGTSLPELVTAVASARQKVSDLALGNLLGANIANLTLIVGSAAAIHPVAMSRATQLVNFPALLVSTVLVVVMGLSGGRLTRREGWGLLGFYVGYLVLVGGLFWSGRG